MPNATTLRDVAPHLEKLRQLIVIPQIGKKDLICRVEIAEHLNILDSLDIEAIVIETHALGQVGTVMADTVRTSCAEILSRLKAFWRDSYCIMDKQDKLKNDDFDEYDINQLFKKIELFDINLNLYKSCLIAVNKLPLPEDCKMDQYRQEIGRCLMEEAREKWIKAKYELANELQKSLAFDEFLGKPKQPLYSNLRGVCNKIYRTIENYFPPCEIRLPSRLRDTFIEYIQQPNGSYAGPPIIHKVPGRGVKQSDENVKPAKENFLPEKSAETKREWGMELFPMILVSKLYEICADIFDDSTETQFHSSLNLHGKHEPLRIKSKQKIKVCYLISKLYDIVPEKYKAAWREDILLHFDIDGAYYESKYSNPRGSDASRSSIEFADDVDEVIKSHKKRA